MSSKSKEQNLLQQTGTDELQKSKKSRFNIIKNIAIVPLFVSLFLLTGCGLLNVDKDSQIDPPEDLSIVTGDEISISEIDGQLADGEVGLESSNTINTELYLVDKNGYVVPQTVSLPREEAIAKLSLQLLVKNGPYNDLIPNGFQAVLPVDTEINGINVEDGLAVVDLSNEFANYKEEDEAKIMQSLAWTLTQFETIDRVKLQINGHDLTEMPVNGMPLGEGLTRKIGINVDTSDVTDLTNTKPLTVYYLGENGDSYYYVPVTKRISNKVENNIEAAIDQLVAGPSFDSRLVSEFLPDVALIDKPEVVDGKVTLNFNESLINSVNEDNVISDQALMSIVLSLTEQQGIESVSVMVNGNDELVKKSGEKLSEAVTRPAAVNVKDM